MYTNKVTHNLLTLFKFSVKYSFGNEIYNNIILKSVRSTPKHVSLCLLLTVETHSTFLQGWLFQRNAQSLGLASQSLRILILDLLALIARLLLDLGLAVFLLAPGSQDEVLLVKGSHEICPVVCEIFSVLTFPLSFIEHLDLYRIQCIFYLFL